MNIGFLASFITFCLIVTHNIKKQARNGRKQEKSFWARESEANSVRRKPLDGLPYIKIPLESFPTHLLNADATVLECIEVIESLTSEKILNLTGWTNTDLKLEYGAANITALSEYDQNYTLLVRTLQKCHCRCDDADRGRICRRRRSHHGVRRQHQYGHQPHLLSAGGILGRPGQRR